MIKYSIDELIQLKPSETLKVSFDHVEFRNIIEKVVELQMKRVQKMLEQQGFSLHWTQETIDDLADLGYDPDFGARPVKRAIQDYVLNDLSRKILEGKIGKEVTLGKIKA